MIDRLQILNEHELGLHRKTLYAPRSQLSGVSELATSPVRPFYEMLTLSAILKGQLCYDRSAVRVETASARHRAHAVKPERSVSSSIPVSKASLSYTKQMDALGGTVTLWVHGKCFLSLQQGLLIQLLFSFRVNDE